MPSTFQELNLRLEALEMRARMHVCQSGHPQCVFCAEDIKTIREGLQDLRRSLDGRTGGQAQS